MPTKSCLPVRARPEPRHWPVLALLLQAWDYAQKAGVDPWQFAEELPGLRAAGASHADLRWLLENGWVAHAAESTRRHSQRRFARLHNLGIPANACFTLTPPGVQLARRLSAGSTHPLAAPSSAARDAAAVAVARQPIPLSPRYDLQRRELWCGPHLVKRFRRPAENQELILTVFEEESWIPRIDDPLPVKPGRDAKLCLHDAINHLNRNQVNRILRFAGDGSGKGIHWHQNGTR